MAQLTGILSKFVMFTFIQARGVKIHFNMKMIKIQKNI